MTFTPVYTEVQNYERYKIILPYMKTSDIDQISTMDCYRFYSLSSKQLEKLIKLGYVEEYDSYCENATSLESIIKLLKKFPKLKLSGYIISNNRQDARIRITTVKLNNPAALDDVLSLGLLPDVESEEELEQHEANGTLHQIKWWYIVNP